MDLPIVTRNNFVKAKGKIYIDIVSKVFIYFELLLGLNRFPVVSESRVLAALFYMYSLIVNVSVCYFAFLFPATNNLVEIIRMSRLLEYEIAAILNMFIWKRFHSFYKEIASFDCEVGCRPKITISLMKLLFSLGLCVYTTICVSFLSHYRLYVIPGHVIVACEHFYFGYLINLITTRMRFLNYHLECSTSIAKTDSSPNVTEFAFFGNDSRQFCFPNICKMMELYQIIIKAHEFLVDAVKWLVSYIYIVF